MLNPKTRRYILQILPFGLIWFVFSLIYTFIEKGILGDSGFYPSTGNQYNFLINFSVGVIFSTITGLIIGTIEVLYLSKLFKEQSFSKKIFFKTAFYIVLIFVFLMVNTIVSNSQELEVSLFDEKLWDSVWAFLSNFAFWSIVFFIGVIMIFTLFYAEVSDNLGQGVLHNFFTGKYHHPVVEERIFMFCDMKSSTTIAEKLGHVKYFKMLKMYYADLSDPIIHYAGEIYQYVGDEIVVSWKMKNGLHDDNCLQCFFAMKKALSDQSEKYQKLFGLVPTFKSGFHYGEVTTGEIGVIKKDIIFTGDVLNTTARIQGLCNDYDVDLLISDHLIKKLALKPPYQIKNLGKSELRGRDEKVELFTAKLEAN